jgi:hypothetical protein
VHPKSGLIREAVFGVRGLIRGMTSGRRYLIREVVFDRNGVRPDFRGTEVIKYY